MRKIKVLLATVLVVLTAAFSLGQDRFRAPRKTASERWFVIKIKGQVAGYLHVTRKASGDASAPILFEYEKLIDSKDEKTQINIQTYCEDNHYYSPVKTTAQIRQPDEEPATIEAVMEKKTQYGCSKSKMRLVYQRGDKKHELNKELPEHTVTEFSLMELIERFPFVEGPVIEFNFLDITKIKVRKRHKIRYLGLEKIEIGGRERVLHKFEQKGAGIKKVHYWLDDNHQLLRILKGKKEELLLSSRAEAWKPTVGW